MTMRVVVVVVVVRRRRRRTRGRTALSSTSNRRLLLVLCSGRRGRKWGRMGKAGVRSSRAPWYQLRIHLQLVRRGRGRGGGTRARRSRRPSTPMLMLLMVVMVVVVTMMRGGTTTPPLWRFASCFFHTLFPSRTSASSLLPPFPCGFPLFLVVTVHRIRRGGG